MPQDRSYYVYIMASHSQVLYIGTTSDLERRVYQHKAGLLPGFTSRYRVNRLVYFEETPKSRAAVARERQIKGWVRERKLRLIESVNAGWIDLAEGWFRGTGEADPSLRSG
ncbi:MAG TPA: GIY-YIG nuclease family protein [Gemmatimonadales bacterium]|nr:GIY-YIG nuclease family protein [Gemmatimonadales bacterium]